MANLGQILARTISTALLCAAIAACSNGSDPASSTTPVVTTNPPDDPVIAETIEGIATPSSVAVVTATNAT